jgi:hypothetical protein
MPRSAGNLRCSPSTSTCHVLRVGRVGAGDRAAAADLHPVVGQQAVVEAQRARIGDEGGAPEARPAGARRVSGRVTSEFDRIGMIFDFRLGCSPLLV